MPPRSDYYQALGVAKNATQDEIKKSYRKLARQYHPDRNPGNDEAEERFKSVQEAYDVLGDPEKRRQYDRGTGPFATAGGPGGFGGFDPGSFTGGLGDIFDFIRTAGGGGAGTVIEDPCPACAGTGARKTVKKYRVSIPAGVRDGSRIRLAGKGEPGRNGGPPGDLYVVTRVSPSPLFKRKGDNLEVEIPLTIPEAIRGATIEVPTLHGTKKLRVPGGTKHGT